MEGIDQAQFHFNEKAGLVVALMVGFLVFAVALDLKWEQFRRVFRRPKAPGIGLLAQFGILPAVAYGVTLVAVDTPSVALGLLLVACCPGGALSNYLTGVAKGDVATSVSMTAVSTIVSVIVTPAVFALWASMNPETSALLQTIQIDPKKVVMVLVIMLVLPVTVGMWLCARRPELAARMRVWVRRLAMLVFSVVVTMVLASNAKTIINFAGDALVPVLLAFICAMALGWILGRLAGLGSPERRAVTIEVGLQNVALALGMAMAFFPSHTGVAVTCAMWGAVHIVGGVALAASWSRVPVGAAS